MGGGDARRRSCDRLLALLEDCRRKHHHMADVRCLCLFVKGVQQPITWPVSLLYCWF
jgi:hypothetical protein